MTIPIVTAAAVAALLTPSIPPAPAPAQESAAESAVVEVSGHTAAPDGRLRRGCSRHRFSWQVRTPYDDWSLETSIRDRTGRAVASHAFLGPGDPKQGTATFRLCRWTTKAGRFTISAKLISYDGTEQTVVHLAETQFRLRRPARPS